MDVAYLKTIPAFAAILTAALPKPVISERPISNPNAFDWKTFLITSGIREIDAVKYAQTLNDERFDKAMVLDVERSVLKELGFAEGDIVRLRRALDVTDERRVSKNSIKPLDVITPKIIKVVIQPLFSY